MKSPLWPKSRIALLALAIPFAASILCDAAHAGPLSSPTIQSITTRDGLSSNLVTAMIQDRLGFLWLAGPEGLVRYDGLEMVSFDRRNTPEFETHNATALAEDPRGFLWIGTGSGRLYRMTGERIESVLGRSQLPHPEICALHLAPEGDLWIGTRGGLCRLRGDQLKCYGLQDGLPSVWISGDTGATGFQALATDRTGRLWVATTAGGAYLDGESFKALVLPNGELPVALRLDPRGNLWAGTNFGRIGTLDEQGLTPRIELDPSILVSAIVPDSSGTALWFGTTAEGLGHWDGHRVEMVKRRSGLPGDQILSLLTDREGNLWAGTFNGLVRLSETLISQASELHGLIGRTVVGLSVGARGLWAVTEEGGLHIHEGARFRPVPGGAGERRGDVRRVLETRDGTVWIGTRRGLFRLGNEALVAAGEETSGSAVLALFEDRSGTIWVGTTNNGLYQRTATGWRHWDVEDGLPDHGVYTLEQSHDGSVWVGTRKGLARIKGNQLTAWREADGLPDPLVVALHEDAEGTLWLGTVSAGLVRFRDGRFFAIQEKQGLPDNTVWAILEDQFGYFWLSGNRGIVRVLRHQLQALTQGEIGQIQALRYGPSEGLVEPDCVGGFLSAAIAGPDGKLYFATSGGVAVVADPSRAMASPPPPPVQILSARIDGELHDAARSLEMPAGSRRLELNLSAPTFVSSEWVQIRERLIGFDDTWNPVGRRREVTYTNLPPGNMVLEASATRDGHTWSEPTQWRVHVQPHWYQTSWFKVLALAVLVIAGPSFYRYRIGQVLRRQRELSHLVRERTEALRLANLALVEKNEQLAELSAVDGLTGLANRRRFDNVLSDEWRRAARKEGWVSLVMADVDAFKQYNDTLGHPAGDVCLKAIADVLAKSARRAGELAARIGGEEFCLVLPGAPPDNMMVVAQALCDRIRALGLPHPSSPVAPVVTVSVGGTSARADIALDAEALLAAADAALYEAKQTGRNRVVTRVLDKASDLLQP